MVYRLESVRGYKQYIITRASTEWLPSIGSLSLSHRTNLCYFWKLFGSCTENTFCSWTSKFRHISECPCKVSGQFVGSSRITYRNRLDWLNVYEILLSRFGLVKHDAIEIYYSLYYAEIVYGSTRGDMAGCFFCNRSADRNITHLLHVYARCNKLH